MASICVIGGGPAGFFAAIAAGRAGAQVTLLESSAKASAVTCLRLRWC